MKSINWYAILAAAIIILACVGIAALVAVLVMFLWNWLAPLFWSAAPILNYVQAFGVVALLSLIRGFIFRKRS